MDSKSTGPKNISLTQNYFIFIKYGKKIDYFNHLRSELTFGINMKLVAFCLNFSTHIRARQLDTRTSNYGLFRTKK
jgi:hypothetical protein